MKRCAYALNQKSLVFLQGSFVRIKWSYMKPFKNKEQQVDILESRGLLLSDKEKAKKILMRYGYYEIVNGYKTLLLDQSQSTDTFQENITFEHLIALYDLDKNIRNGVMRATLEIELSLRTAIAYTLAEDYGVEDRHYLNYKNFRQGDNIGRNKNSTNERAIMLSKLQTILTKDIEPLNHYRTNHNHIPPWILLKETTFGTLKHLFKLLKGPQKEKVISICYGIDINNVTADLKSLFKDSLSVINSFRNRAAHCGRIFNYKSNIHYLRYNNTFHNQNNFSPADYRSGLGKSDIYTLSKVLSFFENNMAQLELDISINYYIERHCNSYPNDRILLSREMSYPISELDLLQQRLDQLL